VTLRTEPPLTAAGAHPVIGAIAIFAVLTSPLVRAEPASAPTALGQSTGSIDLGARGGLTPEPALRTPLGQDGAASSIEFNARAGLATDYIYRGVTLSARKPAMGAGFEAAYGMFYAASTFATVNLPSQPALEITAGGGFRPTLGPVNFDFSWTYFFYPDEMPPPGVLPGINYWEAIARADTRLGEFARVAGGFAYSPNVSNTGAWSKYAAFGLGIDLPGKLLPAEVAASLTGIAGYSWFGNQKEALGGFPLPAYLNWNFGVTFSRKNLNLDMRYYDTNLSKENCYVFTGDPSATPGGQANPVTNPEGLMSRWCSATFVAKFWFTLN
jgi:uncharacterized protein (TIGR02001 family)